MIPLLILNNFVPIASLEKELCQFEFEYEKKQIKLIDFHGQLERKKKNGAPFWNIILKTTVNVTARQISSYLYQKLLKSENKCDPILKVQGIQKFTELKPEDRFLIDHPKWSPSFFNKKFFETHQTMTTKTFDEWLKKRPKKYSD